MNTIFDLAFCYDWNAVKRFYGPIRWATVLLDWFRCDANQPAGRVPNEFSQPILWVLCPEAGTTGLSHENLSFLMGWRGGRGISESRTRFRGTLPQDRLEINYFFPFERNQNFAIRNPQTATISIKP